MPDGKPSAPSIGATKDPNWKRTGTVSKSERSAVDSVLDRENKLRKNLKEIDPNANVEGINKFVRQMQAKNFQNNKDINTDEGYKKYVLPEIEAFNKANPNIAITPDHVAKLQDYYSKVDPSVVKDSRFGTQTFNLLYPTPNVAKVSSTVPAYQQSSIDDFQTMYDVKTLPDFDSGGGYTSAKKVYVEKGTGKIVDPTKSKFEGSFYDGKKQTAYDPGYTGETYDELVKRGGDRSVATSNAPVITATGNLKTADVIETDPNATRTIETRTAGNQGRGIVDKNLMMAKTLPPTTSDKKIIEEQDQPGREYKKGGIVGKVKGYRDGTGSAGTPPPEERGGSGGGADGGESSGGEMGGGQMSGGGGISAGGASQVIAPATELMALGGDYMDQKSYMSTGKQHVGQATGAGALKGGAKGAKLGMQMGQVAGPKGALIGAGVGLVAGATIGGVNANKQAKELNESIETAEKLAEWEKQQMIQNNQFSQNLSNQMSNRKTGYGYRNGGLVMKFRKGGKC